ncbi:MAG: kelch repeat-containing protein [Sphaerochaetaceae bacterium]|nr:kelch repeat-containing protein [Sphaerochaetaceae bacterium]
MNKGLHISVIISIILMTVLTGCDSWSTYPPDDKYGQNEYDGQLTWSQLSFTDGWSSRYKHASTVYDGKLWVFGGYGYQDISSDSYLEDVWYSQDGATWVNATSDAPWKGRAGHCVVVLNDTMYLIGGFAVDEDDNDEDTNHYMSDVWSSTDGENWTEVTADAAFGDRAYHAAVVVNDTIYVIGGRKNGTYYYDDIWKSADGETWTEVSLSDEDREILEERAAMAVATDGDYIYIQGGYTSDYELAQVDQTDWKKIRRFDTVNNTVEKMSRPGGSSYGNRAMMKMVNYDGRFFLFSGADVKREYSMDYDDFYSTWTYDYTSDSWSLDSAGSGYGPRHGYTAQVFDAGDGEKIWILGGWSYTGTKDDVWTAEVEE